ncbi:MAG: response regulator [Pseudomonadota bacterium]|nr:response regulator [Pseudomonadota bacterium]
MTPGEPTRESARLLVVDDEPTHLRALCDTLEEQGFDVQACNHPSQALEALRRSRYDLLLSDLAMPDMNGIELLRAALLRDPSMVAIIMTGEGTIGSAVEAMKSGAFDFMLKPFNLSAVLPTLERGLEMRRLRHANAALERRVREHAAELELANRELDAFTRSASHDLRSPLNAVLGFSTLLLHKVGPHLPPDQRALIVNTELAARRMDQLISALMRLSRLGRHALRLHPVDLNALVQSVVLDLRRDQPQRDVSVDIHRLPAVIGDEVLLRQVFFNLLSNAFKFTSRVACALVEVGCLDAAADPPVYFVRDNGAGFDAQRAGRLFEAFSRLHRSADFEGSGVGLSIVRRVVQRHGGRIWAESVPGRGATFLFTLRGDRATPAQKTPAA